jgi:hypothetical protein
MMIAHSASRKNALQDLHTYLKELNTDPNIIDQLIKGIENWQNGASYGALPKELDQGNIGWEGIAEGTIGKHWSETQHIYKNQNNLATSGQKWTRLVIRKLWKIAWEI